MRHRLGLRVLAWAGIPVLLGLRILVESTVEDPVARFVWAELLTYLGPMLLASVICGVLAIRYRSTIEQRFWGLLSAACAMLLVSETYWDWYVVNVAPSGPGFDGWYKYFAVAAAALFFTLLVSMTRVGNTRSPRRLRLYLDLFAVMVVSYTCVYAFWVLPSLAGFARQVEYAAWVSAWPVAGVTMVFVITAIMAGFKAYRWRPWERLAAASHAIFAVGLVSFPLAFPLLLTRTTPSSTWYTLVLGCGLYLLCVAGIYRLTAGNQEALAKLWPVPSQGLEWPRRVYPLILVFSLPLIGLQASLLSAVEADGPLIGAAVVLAVLLGLRSWLLVLEVAHHRARAVTDPLTGAYTSAYFRERLESAARDLETSEMSGWLVLLRVADFERLDEVFGREAGDAVLRRCVDALMAEGTGGTEVYRVGDREFVALLQEPEYTVATAYVERVDQRVRDSGARPVPPFVVSYGLARPESGDASWQISLERARAASEIACLHGERLHVFQEGDEERLLRDDTRPLHLRTAMLALAAAGDARDPLSPNHSARVSRLAVALAQHLELDADQVELVRVSGLLHDVGKIGVSAAVLSRPGGLSAAEREAVERHCELGERLVLAAGLAASARVVRHHHERWDGRGYPDGLAGKRIPLESRLLAVCDVLETLTAIRPYSPAVGIDAALDEIESCAGRQFDPRMSAALVRLIRESDVPPIEFHPIALPEGEAHAS